MWVLVGILLISPLPLTIEFDPSSLASRAFSTQADCDTAGKLWMDGYLDGLEVGENEKRMGQVICRRQGV